jgi:long-chain acyl-CoA synthetase
VRLDAAELTYSDLDGLSDRVAGWLTSQGIEPGAPVGLMVPNVLAFPVLYYGILRAGGIIVPMNPLLKAREVEHYLGDSGARLAFVVGSAVEEASAGAAPHGSRIVPITDTFVADVADWPPSSGPVDRDDHDTAVILYTSGTTGTPKGAELTHRNMRTNANTAAELFGTGHEDVVMGCLPLFHAFGQTSGMNCTIISGGCLTMIARFDPELALKIIERDRVTVFEGVPTMYVAMLHAGNQVADTSSLRGALSGGAALPAEVLNSWFDAFGVPILEGYGLSETSPVASFNMRGNTRAGSIGHAIPGVEMKVVDDAGTEVPTGEVGEIVIRGDNVMKGYWNRPEATAEAIRDGWFYSGDMAYRDEDGFFFIVDRKKELIIRGGFNVYPREIEEVLYEHPAVLEAAVIGVPHETHGEEVAAAVALKPGSTATAAELRDYVKARVAPYKYPRHVWLLESLPKGATGKILKREIHPPQ